VTPTWARIDEAEWRIPCACIPNGFDPDEFEGSKKASNPQSFTIAYAGNINTGRDDPYYGLRTFFRGLKQTEDRLRDTQGLPYSLKFLYYGGYNSQVEEIAKSEDVFHLTKSHPQTERKAVLAVMMDTDLLLIMTFANTAAEKVYDANGCYPGKVFEYFGAGRPILCIPGDGGLLDELIRDTGTGVTLSSADKIADHLMQQIDHKRKHGRVLYQPKKERINRYTRNQLSGEMASLLNQSISG